MDFSFKDGNITLSAEKKNIYISAQEVVVDGLTLSCPGEYEKGGFLVYAEVYEGHFFYRFRVEGYTLGYAPVIPQEPETALFDFFGQLDIFIAPLGKKEQSFIEKLEPRMLVVYGEHAAEVLTLFGCATGASICAEGGQSNYKLKAADISAERTAVIHLS